ncbi:IS110 family transposase [Limnoglobus roseus]|uniref:IS110 family transposase n=1 Tax=Limnoglobus roseus TaxID=2598579 RepID=A0A5C1ASB6_9BACT|nr:transposase [Limnoglobus roseus]QEL20926.1 IS110 family transposase [Limnoglobus roseus]
MGTAATTTVIGIDISKATLDACLLTPDGKARGKAFPNAPDGFAALLAWADGHAPESTTHFGMEATGGYEGALRATGTPPAGW